MAISFADAISQLTAATGLDAESLLHIGDTREDVAANLALLLESQAPAVALGPARDRITTAFVQGWQQELQKYNIRLRVGAVPIAVTRPASAATETTRLI